MLKKENQSTLGTSSLHLFPTVPIIQLNYNCGHQFHPFSNI
nr:MAG TPA: hypothetical protein [Caudoviricetes sp.]